MTGVEEESEGRVTAAQPVMAGQRGRVEAGRVQTAGHSTPLVALIWIFFPHNFNPKI